MSCRYRTKIRAVLAAERIASSQRLGGTFTANHKEVYGPWVTTPWQRLLGCFAPSSPGGFNGLTLTKGNFANRHSLRLDWLEPTDATNLDFYEIRYRIAGAEAWEYTRARKHALSKVLYADQHGVTCGEAYEVQVRSRGGNGEYAEGAWVSAASRTRWCPPPTELPTPAPVAEVPT